MRKPQGQATLIGPKHVGEVPVGPKALIDEDECDTFTCGHCQFIMHVPVKCNPEDLGGLCKCCMQLICPKCVNKGTCTPWEQMIENMERKQDALRSYKECSD